MPETIRSPYTVPYHAQIASPELAEAIFVEGLDPRGDPRWAESGAATPEEYAYWVERACGVACLQMVVEALGGPRLRLLEWARQGVERGAYLVRRGADGSQHEVGWIHSGLADMAREHGVFAEARPASLEQIVEYLRAGCLVIASISYEVGDDRLPITKRGGHLMLITGAESQDGQPLAFIANNPSGRRANLRADALLPVERVSQGYTGRVILFSPRPLPPAAG